MLRLSLLLLVLLLVCVSIYVAILSAVSFILPRDSYMQSDYAGCGDGDRARRSRELLRVKEKEIETWRER